MDDIDRKLESWNKFAWQRSAARKMDAAEKRFIGRLEDQEDT